jgi:hypothetical protein
VPYFAQRGNEQTDTQSILIIDTLCLARGIVWSVLSIGLGHRNSISLMCIRNIIPLRAAANGYRKPPWVCIRSEPEAVSTCTALLHSDSPNEQVTTAASCPYCAGTRLALGQVLISLMVFCFFPEHSVLPRPHLSSFKSTIIWHLIQRYAT